MNSFFKQRKGKSPKFWILIVSLTVIAVLAAVLLTNPGSRSEYSNLPEYQKIKKADIRIEVEGAGKSKLTTADFMKMPLTEQEMVILTEDGREETLTLTGVLPIDLLNYLDVEYMISAHLTSADGKEAFFFLEDALFAVCLSGELLPDESGPVWFAVGGEHFSTMSLKQVEKIRIATDGEFDNGFAYIPPGSEALEKAARAAGYEIATITDLPERYRLDSVIINTDADLSNLPEIDKSFVYGAEERNNVTIEWIDTNSDTRIILIQHQREIGSSDEPIIINGIEGTKFVREAGGSSAPALVALHWFDGRITYNLMVANPDTVEEDLAYELAQSVQ